MPELNRENRIPDWVRETVSTPKKREEAKPEVKVEAKPEVKVETTPEVKPETKIENPAAPITGPSAEAKTVEVKAETSVANTEVKVEAKKDKDDKEKEAKEKKEKEGKEAKEKKEKEEKEAKEKKEKEEKAKAEKKEEKKANVTPEAKVKVADEPTSLDKKIDNILEKFEKDVKDPAVAPVVAPVKEEAITVEQALAYIEGLDETEIIKLAKDLKKQHEITKEEKKEVK